MVDITEDVRENKEELGYIDGDTVWQVKKKAEEKIVLFVYVGEARIKQILRDVVRKLIIIVVLYAANIGKQTI
ncbi:MAG TPA: hypothetical protein VE643_04630 [Nitrososphaeraceae archaeon]|nr:hypothetical protein [Nitrososphaeraceae archaeon]